MIAPRRYLRVEGHEGRVSNARGLWVFLSIVVLAVSLVGCGDASEREAKYLKRGEVLYEKGEFDKARLEFKNAAQIKPTDAEVISPWPGRRGPG